MQMASSSSAYLLPAPSSSISSKSTLIKQTLPPPPPPITAIHSVHHVAQHQLQHPIHRSSASTHSHQPFLRTTTPNNDTFHSLTVSNPNGGTSLLTTNNNNNNNCNNNNNTSSVLTTNNSDDNSGSGGHSLSQSMESINNIGLTDDEVSRKKH